MIGYVQDRHSIRVMISMELLSEARDLAVRAALAAGHLVRSEAGRVEADAIEDKGTHDLVTRVDFAAQERILSMLHGAFPEFDILAEEDGDGASGGTADAEFRWIVDPIDGTTNFAHGVPPYAVSIGLAHRTGMVVGVVYDVSHDELFTAVRGGGLQVNGRPATVSGTRKLDDGLVTTGFPYRSYGHVDVYMDVLRVFVKRTRGVRRPGSASVDLAWVACGRFDGFFETGLMPWDVAAGCLLVAEGGGRVSDYAGDGDPVFGRQILATNGHVHEAMREILRPMRDVRD